MSAGPALLLVDDRPDNLLALQAVLEPLGHPMLVAGSGDEALRHLLHADVAVIVLDVQMPGMDGFETAEHIKQRERTKDIPILFLTAISREDRHRMRGYETGAVDYVFKPVDADVLRAKVSVFFDLRMANRALAQQAAQLERKTAELERSNDDLEQFAYIASHDLQEPLRVVAGFLELLQLRLDARLDDEERDWILRSQRAAAGMTDLVAGLLLYARAGVRPTAPVTVDLDAALSAATARLTRDADVRVAGPLGAALATPDEVVVVLSNLLGNALKYDERQRPPVEVAASQEQGTVTVAVRDYGRGIPDDDLERVFGMFERIDGNPYPGTGLGLAICRKIVERAGGSIWIANNADAGVTVRFTLPAVIP